MLFAHARTQPDAVALDDLDRTRTWAELSERAIRVARWLRDEARIEPGGHAAVLMENRVEYVEVVLGAMLAGVWLTPINRHLRSEEVAYIFEDSGARVVFTDDAHAGLVHDLGRRPQVLVAGRELDAALASASIEPLPLSGPAGATMVYTSGTTGRPKGVKRAKRATIADVLAGMREYGRLLGMNGQGPHLVTGPLYHAAPLLFAIYDLANGAPMIIMPRWSDERTLDLIAARRVAHTHMVPTMFVRLLALPRERRDAADLSSLEVVLHGAAPVGVEIKRQMIEWWGPVLYEYWGATESGVVTLTDSKEWLARSGTVGRPLEGFEVVAVGGDGRRLPAGATGTLYCRNKRLERPFEYHDDDAKTAAAFLEPGVFTIGDIGHVDREGYVYLSDRQANLIISGGVNIYPAEIEQVLQLHPAVADVGVFGIPDAEWGETVKAAVELRRGYVASAALEAEILSFGRARLAGYKVPRSIDFEAELPRHPTGKLHIRSLRERYWQGKERRI